jgi:hypothetical protein
MAMPSVGSSGSSSSRSGVHAAPKEGAWSGVQEAMGRGGEEERKGRGMRGAERGRATEREGTSLGAVGAVRAVEQALLRRAEGCREGREARIAGVSSVESRVGSEGRGPPTSSRGGRGLSHGSSGRGLSDGEDARKDGCDSWRAREVAAGGGAARVGLRAEGREPPPLSALSSESGTILSLMLATHERQYAAFERLAKAKAVLSLAMIPWASAALFKERMRQEAMRVRSSVEHARAANEEDTVKLRKEWCRRWHPDKWLQYHLAVRFLQIACTHSLSLSGSLARARSRSRSLTASGIVHADSAQVGGWNREKHSMQQRR